MNYGDNLRMKYDRIPLQVFPIRFVNRQAKNVQKKEIIESHLFASLNIALHSCTLFIHSLANSNSFSLFFFHSNAFDVMHSERSGRCCQL